MSGASGGRAELACGLVILVALGGTLALTGGGREAGAAPERHAAERPAEPLSSRQVARISGAVTPSVARQVARLRGLELGRPPRPEIVSARYLNRLALRELRKRGGVAIGADEAVGRITGLLRPDEQLEAAYRSTGDLAAAAYDTESKRLYVVSDAAAGNRAMIKFLLSHELDHALEDERFGLPDGAGANGDAALAQQALVEGLATSVMIDYAAAHLDPLSLLAAANEIDTGTGDVPRAFVDQLTWTYLGGNRFIGALRRLADGWKLVDYALSTRPPATTEQVLHPAKYVRDEVPAPVRLDPSPLRSRGWRLADRDVSGELATHRLLALGGGDELARRAAAGWNGDRYELWRRASAPRDCTRPCRDDLVLVMLWRWDSPADARQFGGAARDYVESGLGGERDGTATWRVEGGAVALRSGAEASALVFAPDRATATATAAAQLGRGG